MSLKKTLHTPGSKSGKNGKTWFTISVKKLKI